MKKIVILLAFLFPLIYGCTQVDIPEVVEHEEIADDSEALTRGEGEGGTVSVNPNDSPLNVGKSYRFSYTYGSNPSSRDYSISIKGPYTDILESGNYIDHIFSHPGTYIVNGRVSWMTGGLTPKVNIYWKEKEFEVITAAFNAPDNVTAGVNVKVNIEHYYQEYQSVAWTCTYDNVRVYPISSDNTSLTIPADRNGTLKIQARINYSGFSVQLEKSYTVTGVVPNPVIAPIEPNISISHNGYLSVAVADYTTNPYDRYQWDTDIYASRESSGGISNTCNVKFYVSGQHYVKVRGIKGSYTSPWVEVSFNVNLLTSPNITFDILPTHFLKIDYSINQYLGILRGYMPDSYYFFPSDAINPAFLIGIDPSNSNIKYYYIPYAYIGELIQMPTWDPQASTSLITSFPIAGSPVSTITI